jgi:DNA-binding response OmpR family regulator
MMASAARLPGPRRLRHVLIVEDESPIRTMLTDLLSDAGYGVAQAADGHEALRHLREGRPDLIILDLMLPGLSGWQFLEHSHDQLERSNIPVMILSAIKGGSDYPSALGVAAWLTKPLDVDQFLSAVELMVGPTRPARRSLTEAQNKEQRVLIVEDDRPIRDLVVEHLGDEGFLTLPVESIPEAHSAIAEHRPALVVLDLMLPGLSGFTFLEQRKDDPALATLPVLVLSAAPPDKLLEAKLLGADAFLSKPFDLDALTALVRSFVF